VRGANAPYTLSAILPDKGIGGIFEAQPAAEPGESIIFKTMNSLSGASVVEVLKPEFFVVAPGTRTEDYQHPPPRLKKDKVKRGYAHNGKAENLGIWTTVMSKTKDEWAFIHISCSTGGGFRYSFVYTCSLMGCSYGGCCDADGNGMELPEVASLESHLED